ncbi:MAG: nitric oxide reductase activation protein NorD [Pseudomonadota bacterium]
MEEQIGALWHRLITRAAERRYPEAAVTLDGLGKTAGILFRALGGDGGLTVEAATATAHGARRGMLQRLAGDSRKVELTWLDEATLRLPGAIDLFPTRALNRDLYLWLIALAATSAAAEQPWLLRSQQATLQAFARFPGIRARYARLLEPALALRPAPERLPADEAAQERAIRAALRQPGSVAALPPARRPPHPVHLWLHPNPPVGAADNVAGAAELPPPECDGGSRNAADQRRRQAERVEMPDNKSGFMLFFRAESILSWAEYVRVNRPTEEDDAAGAEQAADDLDRLSVARDQKAVASRLRFDLDLPSAAVDDVPLGGGILLPEWHYRKRAMQPEHCRVQPLIAQRAVPCALPSHLAATARRIRSQFQALAPARVWLKGQFDGPDLDLDACVRDSAERHSGALAGERGLYRAQHRRDRDLACLLLADLSLSTDAWVSDEARVIDVIRDGLFLFAEALSASQDRFALYGFSSLRRDNVRFHTLKDFGESYGAQVRGRIAAVKPGYYTRMGAAIRHASVLLERERAGQRLLLLLTDGKPNDLDQYEGRYGVEDTRQAVLEARRRGLLPFCVTIDEKAGGYLPHLFGPGGYVVIRKPAELPRRLPLLYAQLTR